MRTLTNTNKNGTNAYYITLCAQNIGFSTRVVEGGVSDLENQILPCIAHVIIENKYKHFIVIHKVEKNHLIIADPAKGIKKIKFDEFNKISTGKFILFKPHKKIPVIKNEKQFMKIFTNALLKYKKVLITILFFSFLYTIINIICSYSFQIIIEEAIYMYSLNNLHFIILIITFLSIMRNLLDYLRNKLINFINFKLDFIITSNTLSHIISFPYQYYKNKTTGDILSRISDLSLIKDSLSNIFMNLFIDSILVIFVVFFITKINGVLTLVSIITIILYMLIVKIFNKVLENLIFESKQIVSKVNTNIVETLEVVDTVKGLNLETVFKNKFNDIYSNYVKINYKFTNLHNKENFYKNIIDSIGITLIIFIGSVYVLKEKMTLGQLITYNSLILYFFEPIKNVINSEINIKKLKTAVRRVIDIYSINEEKMILDNKYVNKPVVGDINICNLSYSYNGRNNILKKINLVIKQGDRILLCGNSGSGKSTLMKILMRYYNIDNNKIYISGKDINDYNLLEIRRDICYVSQNEKLITDSVYNNIVLGRDISYDSFLEVCKLFKIDEIVKDDISKYNMLLEENGFNVSGGERQKIILARTLLKKSNIYIFDESLSQLDIKTEREFIKNIFEYLKEKTVIVISHRFYNSDLYDKFYTVVGGKIINGFEGV